VTMKYAIVLLLGTLFAGWGCASGKHAFENGAQGERPASGDAGELEETAGATAAGLKQEAGMPPLTQSEIEHSTESILDVINSLEECYETGDFEKWRGYLTPRYSEMHDDAVYLRAEGWNANDLRSFFKLLIKTRKRGSITTLTVSRIDFVSSNKALVYVILGENEFPEPQHTFIRVGDRWFKGLQDEGE
jgi:hypothetical protein